MRIDHHPILDDLPDRETVTITVNGRSIKAYKGESIAAAMYAVGQKVHRTTSKYKEPRGIFCNKGRCTDCIMKVDGLPNVRTCITKVREGMIIESIDGLGVWGAFDE